VRGQTVVGDLAFDEIDGFVFATLPASFGPVALRNELIAAGRLRIRGPDNLIKEFGQVGSATWTMRFAPVREGTEGFLLQSVEWRFGEASPVPEPATLLLVASGTAGTLVLRRRNCRFTTRT
jgi:hypothetical protein